MQKLFVFLTVVFVMILGAGLTSLPEVFRSGYPIPTTGNLITAMPPGLFLLTLTNIFMFFGVLLALVLHHGLRVMIGLLVLFRIAEVFWAFTLERHSLWFLLFTVAGYLILGGAVILLMTRVERMKKNYS